MPARIHPENAAAPSRGVGEAPPCSGGPARRGFTLYTAIGVAGVTSILVKSPDERSSELAKAVGGLCGPAPGEDDQPVDARPLVGLDVRR